MAEKTLQDLFGANAVQDANSITIAKADLTTLVASANNAGEEIVLALFDKLKTTLPATTYDTDPDQSIKIEYGEVTLETNFTTNTRYAVLPITTTAKKVAPTISFTPADMK